MKLNDRPYNAKFDLESILALVCYRLPERLLDYPSPGDLRELLAIQQIQENTHLWETPGGLLVAYALIDSGQSFASLSFECHPVAAASSTADHTLCYAMLEWGEVAFRTNYVGEASGLSTGCRGNDLPRLALLETFGFQRDAEDQILLSCSLEQELPFPQPPAGYLLRPIFGPQEDEAWVELHRVAHGTENMTLEYRQAMTNFLDYDRELDLVAQAPDGSLAAYVFCVVSTEENALTGLRIGYTDPVSTHPEHQRRGLARALLLAGIQRLQQRGMHEARLGTSSANHPMLAAAHSVGFRPYETFYHYEKTIRNTAENV